MGTHATDCGLSGILFLALFKRGAEITARALYRSVDEYIAAQPFPTRSVLQRVRATIRRALPGASEGISYQIPVYKLDDRMVLYFAGFQHHYSIYPATASLVRVLKQDLVGLLHSKATIRLSYDEPIPTRLITRIAKLRAAEVTERNSPSAAKRKPSRKATPNRPRAQRRD